MLAVPIDSPSPSSSSRAGSRRPSFQLPLEGAGLAASAEGNDWPPSTPDLRKPRQVVVMEFTEGVSPMAAVATTSSKAKGDDDMAVSAFSAAAAPATMKEMHAAYKERQQPKGVKSIDDSRKRQWLLEDPAYLRHSVRQLRVGRRCLRRELDLASEAELFENRCLFSDYARSIRQKRDRRRRQMRMRPGSPYGAPSSAGSDNSPAPSSRGWSRQSRMLDDGVGGGKKSLAQVAVQLRSLTESLHRSHISLERLVEPDKHPRTQRERQKAKLKTLFSSSTESHLPQAETNGSSWGRAAEGVWTS
mmetsp:Transcript_52500/g.125438  ORF Transcript_52500/g.125438 Transcript_52500/m.125438 type:complete len:303 (+) Transcript_52500:127-1035(+)